MVFFLPVNKYTNYQFWSKVIGLVIIIATGLLAYQGLRETWFYPIDDALHLAGVVSGKYPIQHYRPGHFAFNQLLFLGSPARLVGDPLPSSGA